MAQASHILLEQLAARQRRNPSYSLRAFARDLGLHPGTLSSILKHKRAVPTAMAEEIATRLEMRPRQRATFLKALAAEKQPAFALSHLPETRARQLELDDLHYRVIAEWEHYAILTLMEVAEFRSDPAWIARRLGLSIPRVEDVLRRLAEVELIRVDERGKLTRTFERLTTPEDVSSTALRAAHREELDLARRALDNLAVEVRDLSSMTMAIAPSDLPAAKEMIRAFRKQLAAALETDQATDVYQLCIQLFPLTQGRSP